MLIEYSFTKPGPGHRATERPLIFMTKYKIIDNFLDDRDFNELCSLNLKKTNHKEISVYTNKIYKNGDTEVDCINKETITRLFNTYHKKGIEILKELNPEKVDLYEYSTFEIVETGSQYKFTIHDDPVNVLLSSAIYLKPSENVGTVFYKNKRGDGQEVVEWKQNRAVFFSRKEKKTWHSFRGDGKNNRIVLVYNLMTTDIRGVCKIEGINYFFAKFRNYLNPYLYKYLNFTI